MENTYSNPLIEGLASCTSTTECDAYCYRHWGEDLHLAILQEFKQALEETEEVTPGVFLMFLLAKTYLNNMHIQMEGGRRGLDPEMN